MAETIIEIVEKGLGPTIWNEVNTADNGELVGKSISIVRDGPNSTVTYTWALSPVNSQLSYSQVQTLLQVIEDHIPTTELPATTNQQLVESVEREVDRLLKFQKHQRLGQDFSPLLDLMKKVVDGGVE